MFNVTRVQLTAGAPMVCEADVAINIGQELVTISLPVPVTDEVHAAMGALRSAVHQSLESSVLDALHEEKSRTAAFDADQAGAEAQG